MARLLQLPRPAPPLFLLGSLLLLLQPSALIAADNMGGLHPESVDGGEVLAAAAFAVDSYNERDSSSSYYFKPLRILKAQSQVVSGMKYYLTMELVNTLCEKKSGVSMDPEDLLHCAVPPEDQQQKLICDFEVWSRPWLVHGAQTILLSSSSCKAATS